MKITLTPHFAPKQFNNTKIDCNFKARLPEIAQADVFALSGVKKNFAQTFFDRVKNTYKVFLASKNPNCKRINFSKFQKGHYSKTLRCTGTEYIMSNEISDVLFRNNNGKKILNVLEESKNLTLDDKIPIKDYQRESFYEYPVRFAIAVLNTFQQKGNAHIAERVPKLFEGVNQKELFKKLDKLPDLLERGKKNIFNIDGKYFTADYINLGGYGVVYKIQDFEKKCPPVAMKMFFNPYKVAGQGIFNEIGLARELNRQKVTDVPIFYMANPIGSHYMQSSEGGWMINEFVKGDTPFKRIKDGVRIRPFMHKHSLEHFDFNNGTCVGNYIVDLGGIQASSKSKNVLIHKFDGTHDLENIFKGLRKGEKIQDIINALTKRLYGEKV